MFSKSKPSQTLYNTTVVIDCGYLSNPEKGRVVLSGTICGSTASYSCNEGYRLVGDAARSCLTDASWSGSAPVCIGMRVVVFSSLKDLVHQIFYSC